MNAPQVARVLEEIGTLLELKGENPFKCRAYHNAARVIGTLTDDIQELVRTEELQSLKGVGKAISQKVTELVLTGRIAYHEELKKEFPAGVVQLLKLHGLGPKRIKILYESLHIENLEQLEAAVTRHALVDIPGFGKKIEENILQSIRQLQAQPDKHLFPVARAAAERIKQVLRALPGVHRCDVAGSLRRKKETIGDLDFVVSASANDAPRIMEAFVRHPDVETVLGHGETKSSVSLYSGIHCDLRIVEEHEFPFAMAYFTGSKEHNVEMRARAKQFGYSLNEYGFSLIGSRETRGKAKDAFKCRSEADIYKVLDLAYVAPELREHTGELDAAERNALPSLVEESDLRGTFHCHTTYSDGVNSLVEMVNQARVYGWEYIGIADHSKRATYANGLTEARLKQQLREIDTLNSKQPGFRIFKGTEVDILPDGSLDWSDTILARFDYVVASIHSKFKMTESEATQRIVSALRNPYVTILGHPTGRLLLRRDGYPVNMTEVITAAADLGKVIEINADPNRLDMDWRLCRFAKERGVKIAINPDAHSVEGLHNVTFGVGIARKGWLEKTDIVNCWDVKQVTQFFRKQ